MTKHLFSNPLILSAFFALLVGFAPASRAALVFTEGQIYDYGDVAVGNTLIHVFTVTNTGSQEARHLSSAKFYAPFTWTTGNKYPGGGTCGMNLAAGASCTVSIKFNPTSVGTFQQILLINSQNQGYADLLMRGDGI